MITTLNNVLVGVVCKDKHDFQAWVAKQSYNPLRRYLSIINLKDTQHKFDEIIFTTTAEANPNFIDIYHELNGTYLRTKRKAIVY